MLSEQLALRLTQLQFDVQAIRLDFNECSTASPDGRRTLVDNVVAAVDVKRLAGDEPGRVVGQEGGGDTHVVDAHQAPCGSLGFCLVEQGVELGNARGGPCRQRSGGNESSLRE